MVSWRDTKNVSMGETDLAHSEGMVYTRRGSEVCDDEEYTVGGIPPQEDIVKDPGRFAFAVTARYRRGTEEEYLYPVRRFSWDIPTRNMEIVDLSRLNGLAQFMIRLKEDLFYRVDGFLKGLLNLRGQEQDYYPPKEFAYDAYMSCVVLEPSFRRLKASSTPEDYVRESMRGKWTTAMKSGFSPALTHAFAAAFRRRFSGWPFFALAPVFYIEGREGSIGKAVMWIVEPANSGRTVWPVLKALFEESAFWTGVFEDACDVLGKCTELWQLRLCSKLAFADETLEKDDVDKALAILKSIRDKRKEAESATGRDDDEDQEDDGDGNDGDGTGDEDEDKEKKGGSTAGEDTRIKRPKRRTGVFSDEEKEFENVVLAALNDFKDTIDVTDTAFVRANFTKPDEVMDLFNDILWNHPEIFYVSKSYRYYREWLDDGTIKSFLIQDIDYGITRNQYAEAKARLDAALKDAMESVKGIDDPVMKALKLHDYLIRTCDYDEVARAEHDTSPLARTAYSALVRHLAVCEGYTMAYRYLLTEAGITSEEVLSDAMNHCWNYVRLGENWYHVDVTWDDPVSRGGKPAKAVSREHFLLSDAAIRAKEHYDWDVRGLPPASDTTYDNHDWTRAPTKRKSEDGVPWEQYRNHVLLRARDSGNVQRCRGEIHIRVFFVDDAKASWDDTARMAYRAVVNDAIDTLHRESGLGAGLEMSWSEENLKMAGSFDDYLDAHDFVPTLLGVSNRLGVTKYQNDLRKSQRCDEAPLVFVWNWGFRDSAHQVASQSKERRSGEWVTIGVDDMANDPAWEKHTFIHELLHLFGAADFYYPCAIKTAAQKWLPDSVMNSGNGIAIDDLTRVLIGWDSTLTESAEQFLKATSSITLAEIKKARATS